MITLNDDQVNHLRRVLQYLTDDEFEDYAESDDKEGHIAVSIVALWKALGEDVELPKEADTDV